MTEMQPTTTYKQLNNTIARKSNNTPQTQTDRQTDILIEAQVRERAVGKYGGAPRHSACSSVVPLERISELTQPEQPVALQRRKVSTY